MLLNQFLARLREEKGATGWTLIQDNPASRAERQPIVRECETKWTERPSLATSCRDGNKNTSPKLPSRVKSADEFEGYSSPEDQPHSASGSLNDNGPFDSPQKSSPRTQRRQSIFKSYSDDTEQMLKKLSIPRAA
eukprot:scaffold1828_cov98-Cylindrotheca_fusiformis.AAC.1